MFFSRIIRYSGIQSVRHDNLWIARHIFSPHPHVLYIIYHIPTSHTTALLSAILTIQYEGWGGQALRICLLTLHYPGCTKPLPIEVIIFINYYLLCESIELSCRVGLHIATDGAPLTTQVSDLWAGNESDQTRKLSSCVVSMTVSTYISSDSLNDRNSWIVIVWMVVRYTMIVLNSWIVIVWMIVIVVLDFCFVSKFTIPQVLINL